MAARIVYDGVGGSGGDLFEGTTFHVHQRVPMREAILQKIKSNGGELKLLEKGADIIIADSARKDCPPGSVCWKYIEDSVKKGELQDIEDYPTSKVSRATNGTAASGVASGSPSKTAQFKRVGRVPFTHEDDRVLMEFCTRKEKAGGKLKGNVIFLELEQINSRHSYQSWRDRWVKHLQDLPRPQLDDDEEDEDDEPAPARYAPKPKSLPKASRSSPRPIPNSNPKSLKTETVRPLPQVSLPKSTTQIPRAGPSKTGVRASTVTPVKPHHSLTNQSRAVRPYVEISAGGTRFTEEETHILFDHYDSIMDLDQDRMIDAWIAWSIEHPNHTPQEWSNHFNREVKGNERPPKKSKRKPTPISSPVSSPHFTRSRDKGKEKATDSDVAAPSMREVKDSQGSSNNTIKSPENFQSSDDLHSVSEEKFKANLLLVAENIFPERFKQGIDFNPDVCDVPTSLYEIWQKVYILGGPNELSTDNRWPELARELGFVSSQRKRAGRELEAICSDLLAGFKTTLDKYRGPSDSQAEQEIEDQLQAEANQAAQRSPSHSSEENDDEELEDQLQNEANQAAQRYPPSRHGREKDGIENEDYDRHAALSRSPTKAGVKRTSPDRRTPAGKRQKLDQSRSGTRDLSEIPSTPEDVINSRKRKSPHKPSPLKHAYLQAEEDFEDEEPSFLMSEKSPSPVKAVPRIQMLEPETQDFHFDDSPPKQLDDAADNKEEEQQPVPISPPPLRTKKLPMHPPSGPSHSNPSSTNATRNGGPSQIDSSAQSQTASQKKESYEEFSDRCTALGYTAYEIGEALAATSITLGPISMRVMQSLKEGKGIPDGEANVWTKKDDVALKNWTKSPDELANKKRMHKVVLKHGKEAVRDRKKYLRTIE